MNCILHYTSTDYCCIVMGLLTSIALLLLPSYMKERQNVNDQCIQDLNILPRGGTWQFLSITAIHYKFIQSNLFLFDCRKFATNQKSKQQLTQIPEAMKNEVLVQRVSVNDKCFISLSINQEDCLLKSPMFSTVNSLPCFKFIENHDCTQYVHYQLLFMLFNVVFFTHGARNVLIKLICVLVLSLSLM